MTIKFRELVDLSIFSAALPSAVFEELGSFTDRHLVYLLRLSDCDLVRLKLMVE